MSPWLIPGNRDRAGREERPITATLDGVEITAIDGQTVAGALLAAGRTSWRTAPDGEPRGVFCGIGVCFDCVVTVNDVPDVRACRRRLVDGDVVRTQTRGGTP